MHHQSLFLSWLVCCLLPAAFSQFFLPVSLTAPPLGQPLVYHSQPLQGSQPFQLAHRDVLINSEAESHLPPQYTNPFYRNPRIAEALAKESWFGPVSDMLEVGEPSALDVDREFLERVMREKESDPRLEVTCVESAPGCDDGANFMSAVTRVLITATNSHNESISKTVLMKRQPANIARRQAFRCDPAFRNEAAAYRVVIPALEKFAKSRMPFPECLHASSQFVVLEDLKQAGYKMADRTVGLDLEHAKLAMRELGRYHGTSLAMKAAQPHTFHEVKNAVQELVLVPEFQAVFGGSLENSLRMALMALEVYRAAGETVIQEAVHKMQVLRGTVFQRMQAMVTPREPLSVMGHGDFYINNMMFKYGEDGEVEGVILVDLQVCRYASLALDILYFLYSSLQPGIISLHHDQLIEEYRTALNRQITTLAPQAKTISLEEILDELETHALFGLLMGFLILPAVTAVPGSINLDKVESTSISEFFESARDILSPVYFERVRELVLAFVDRGYI